MDIQFNYEYREEDLEKLNLGELARFVLEHEECPDNTEVSISFVDNDRIADREISLKIDRIELLTGEIFRYLSKHPEREGELRTFMDYYLPQTLKILETYAQLEAQGVETDNIRKAKDQISDLLDQLTESYERQLDKLFDTDVLDISADIDVMKKMLQNDGLAADELALELEKQT